MSNFFNYPSPTSLLPTWAVLGPYFMREDIGNFVIFPSMCTLAEVGNSVTLGWIHGVCQSETVSHSAVSNCSPRLQPLAACSLPGSSLHAIFQARILECLAIPFSRGPPWARIKPTLSCTANRFFWATWLSGIKFIIVALTQTLQEQTSVKSYALLKQRAKVRTPEAKEDSSSAHVQEDFLGVKKGGPP